MCSGMCRRSFPYADAAPYHKGKSFSFLPHDACMHGLLGGPDPLRFVSTAHCSTQQRATITSFWWRVPGQIPKIAMPHIIVNKRVPPGMPFQRVGPGTGTGTPPCAVLAHLVHSTIALSFDAVLMGARIEASRAQHSLTDWFLSKNMNRDTRLLERKREGEKKKDRKGHPL